MKVIVNNQETEVNATTTVAELVSIIYPEATGGIAVAINNSLVRKAEWENRLLAEHDDVVIIKAAYGG